MNLFRGLRPIQRTAAVHDALAGIVMAAMDIPQVLGYSKIAGMPVVTGLYSLLLPLVAFAAFGSSRYLVVAADSATAAIFADGVSGTATSGGAQYIALACIVAVLTAVILLLARLLQLGFIADFLSRTVLVGFLTGVGFQVGISVLSEMFGVPVDSRRPVVQLWEVGRSLPRANLPTVLLSVSVLAFVLLLRHFAPKVPGALVAVAGAIAASAAWNFAGHGIATIGPVVGGLPHLGLMALLSLRGMNRKEVELLLTVSASCAVMILTQSAATARIYAAKHYETVDENLDLYGLSAANAAAALSGGFVVNGSPTQTAMMEDAGGRSQLAQVATAVVVGVVLLFLTGPLQHLPTCVLGAMVFLVALRLIDLAELRNIRSESPQEYALAVMTAVVVVLVGVEEGIVLAMLVSLARVVRHDYHPHSGVLRGKSGRKLEISVPAAPRCGDRTRAGALPVWRGTFLCQCRAVSRGGVAGGAAHAVRREVGGGGRGGHDTSGLHGGPDCEAAEEEPHRGRRGAGVCARAMGSEIRLRSASRDGGDRARAIFQPAARCDCGV